MARISVKEAMQNKSKYDDTVILANPTSLSGSGAKKKRVFKVHYSKKDGWHIGQGINKIRLAEAEVLYEKGEAITTRFYTEEDLM